MFKAIAFAVLVVLMVVAYNHKDAIENYAKDVTTQASEEIVEYTSQKTDELKVKAGERLDELTDEYVDPMAEKAKAKVEEKIQEGVDAAEKAIDDKKNEIIQGIADDLMDSTNLSEEEESK